MSFIEKKIAINVSSAETRVAFLENGRVSELRLEREANPSLVGDIYFAKVSRIVPGIQAAFVAIGAEKSGFLYGADVIDPEYISGVAQQRSEDEAQNLDGSEIRRLMNKRPIEELLQAGDRLLVQVSKEPMGSKGPRVTTLVTIPGRYLVLMPEVDSVGISKRILSEEARESLRVIIEQIKPQGIGVIVRTAAEGVDKERLKVDLEILLEKWSSIQEKRLVASAPSLLYQDSNLILKTIRDLYSEEVKEVLVDDQESLQEIRGVLRSIDQGAETRLSLWEGEGLLFDYLGIEKEIEAAIDKRVPLTSGGYLIIDQAEALTAMDVNTGKFVGLRSARDTILKTNLEAAQEVAYQLRKRNIGGIIVVDFIDMEDAGDQMLVKESFESALKQDKAKTNVLDFSEFGLLQLTRKRTSDSILGFLCEPCPCCLGDGFVKSMRTISLELYRDIVRYFHQSGDCDITVFLSEGLKNFIDVQSPSLFSELTNTLNISLKFKIKDFSQTENRQRLFAISS